MAKKAQFTPEQIRDLSEKVYRIRLGESDVARQIEKDGDGGAKLRVRAGVYDSLSLSYFEAFNT